MITQTICVYFVAYGDFGWVGGISVRGFLIPGLHMTWAYDEGGRIRKGWAGEERA
jgi:hypothetical protein